MGATGGELRGFELSCLTDNSVSFKGRLVVLFSLVQNLLRLCAFVFFLAMIIIWPLQARLTRGEFIAGSYQYHSHNTSNPCVGNGEMRPTPRRNPRRLGSSLHSLYRIWFVRAQVICFVSPLLEWFKCVERRPSFQSEGNKTQRTKSLSPSQFPPRTNWFVKRLVGITHAKFTCWKTSSICYG